MSFTDRERTVPGICRKCFCTRIAFGKIYFLWCGFVLLVGVFSCTLLPISLSRKFKLISDRIQLKDFMFLCWMQHLQTPSCSQVQETIARWFFQITWRWAVNSLEWEEQGAHTGSLSTSKGLWLKMFFQATEKLHWENGHAKTARPSLGSLHCRYELPALRPADTHWTTTVDSSSNLIFQHGTYEIWLQCRKTHLLLLHIISLSLVHWGMQTLLNSLPRQQNHNKHNSLHARKRKKSKAWNFTVHSLEKKTVFRKTNSTCLDGRQLSVQRAPVSSTASLLAENYTD